MENCFYCDGKNPECVKERKYTPDAEGDCIYYGIAKKDIARLNIGETKQITLRTMLAGYLMDKGRKEEALKVLTLPELL